ncbi:P-type ATPase [Ordospora colligata]|uniref:P-type ATPase n=1 Tax=Ordospora colligata OC4 TaxID=1354746 RepID=A0A0B2UET0_9MICR|nr:P-type ATPase [Ordospora colligata OC4]KHN69591.1 P-type ATPase [Ordospora colligata OC4]TBU15411.1 P-type ATPase [Ordospora colligata]TBU18607.1 P-type ATPase [Ordospora colligata]
MKGKENKIVTSKYTAFTFFPLNMYHQLSRPSNLFFLLTLILLSIPSISPFSPFTYLLAFAIVVGASMVKDGVEDYRRHQHDKAMNQKPANVIRKGSDRVSVEEIYVEDLLAGDFILIMKDQEVPGDVVLLNSKVETRNGVRCKPHCFVETSNLDGESNLKKKTVPSGTGCGTCEDTIHHDNREHEYNNGIYICECDMYYINSIAGFVVEDTGDLFDKFECQVDIGGRNVLYNEKNVLLRGSRVKNTECVLGMIVSVGRQTKLGKSHIKAKPKISLFEKSLSSFIYGVFLVYLIVLILTSVLGAGFLRREGMEYLYPNEYPTEDALKQTGTNYILFSYLIPLSLFVTLEVSRMIHSMFVFHDSQMASGECRSVCRNSNVTEDIGVVDYVLTDKTGTLTKNSMVLKHCHWNGLPGLVSTDKVGGDMLDIDVLSNKDACGIEGNLNDEYWHTMFVAALLCCNSIEPLNGKFEGVSQDELCIVEELRNQGCVLIERDTEHVVFEMNGKRTKAEIEMALEFSSSRQRMSVIVRILGKCMLFCKGADQMLLRDKNMSFDDGDSDFIKTLINTNSEYRSLVVGCKEIGEDMLSEMKSRYNEISLKGRHIEQEKIFDCAEDGLEYLGTTFIEDELQKDVRETIVSLKDAGIKIWMITGDKKETAMSCAEDCGIVPKGQEAQSLVIKGEEFLKKFVDEDVFSYRSIVIYRATPHQKGKIAERIVSFGQNTLAIGDGNNDVPMIKSSHIGVGIMGKEGTQASLSADFAIPEFRLLKRLLLVHGRYNMIRFSKITLNAFFKNIFFISIQFMYNFFNGYSGMPIYNNFFLNYYNVLFTSLVPLSIGLFDKDMPEEYLMTNPKRYGDARKHFGKHVFVFGSVYTIAMGCIVFGLSMGVVYIKDLIGAGGLVGGYILLTNYFSIIVFWVVLATQIREISYFVVYSWVAIALSIFLNFVTLFYIQEVDSTANNAAMNLFSMPVFYLACLFVLSGTFLADFGILKMFSTVKNNIEE